MLWILSICVDRSATPGGLLLRTRLTLAIIRRNLDGAAKYEYVPL